MKKCVILMLLLAGCLGVLSGCSKEQNIEGNSYDIYGLKKGSTRLSFIEYGTETTDTEELIKELCEQFARKQIGDGITTALPERVALNYHKLENQILYMDFSPEYLTINTVSELLCRGALVSTFTQIEGVNSVAVTVGEQPLTDQTGTPVGAQKATDFVDLIGKGLNSVSKVTLSFYFSNESGDKLLKKTEEVAYDSSYVVASAVVNRLIEGPKENDGKYYPTLPSNLKVLSVTVKDNICYVNFDQAFDVNALNIQPYIPIYSVVNSLAELPGIKKVQILINGVSDTKFKDMISLSDPLERNLDYVGGNAD